MDIYVLDKNFNTIHLIDGYKSLIWTDRYNLPGDFELYTEVSGNVLKYVTKDVYLSIKESDRTMIVSNIEIISDREIGNFIKITGSSLEQIIGRRIVWKQRDLNTNLQNGIKALLNENIISPSDSNRKISNFIFESSTDTRITGIKIDTQYTGDNLLDVVNDLCVENDIGFKVVLNSKNQFVFSLYAGVDRTYDQTKNPFVIFSPRFDNLVNSNYYESNENLKTMTLIGGEGEGKDRYYITYSSSSKTGLDRRELFTDARDLQKEYTDDNGNQHVRSDSEYRSLLTERGKSNLADYTNITTFEGEVESRNSFIYKKDYYLGDIVQIENEYGFKGTARITEVIASVDDDGYSIYPTFEMLDIDGD